MFNYTEVGHTLLDMSGKYNNRGVEAKKGKSYRFVQGWKDRDHHVQIYNKPTVSHSLGQRFELKSS